MFKLFLLICTSSACLFVSLLTIPTFNAIATELENSEQTIASTPTIQSITIERTAERSSDPTTATSSSLWQSDQIGDIAIKEYGCDCAGCRNTVVSWLGQDKFTLPK